jgi:hypothetical protein
MEAAEKRRSDEMQRRMAQASAQREKDLSVMKKVMARSVAASHLMSMKDRALAHLGDAGVFASKAEAAVDTVFLPNLLKTIAGEMQENKENRIVVQNVMRTSMQAKLDTHLNVLNAERSRLATIDAAEKKARIERQQEHLRIEAEKQRIEKEQQAMLAWELWQPPTPPEVTITGVTTEEPIKAITVDGQELTVLPERLADLTALLESLAGMAPPKIIVASLLENIAEAGAQYVDDFRLTDEPEEPATEDAAPVTDEGGVAVEA